MSPHSKLLGFERSRTLSRTRTLSCTHPYTRTLSRTHTISLSLPHTRPIHLLPLFLSVLFITFSSSFFPFPYLPCLFSFFKSILPVISLSHCSDSCDIFLIFFLVYSVGSFISKTCSSLTHQLHFKSHNFSLFI